MSSDPHNPMPQPPRAQPAPDQLGDQVAPPAAPGPVEVAGVPPTDGVAPQPTDAEPLASASPSNSEPKAPDQGSLAVSGSAGEDSQASREAETPATLSAPGEAADQHRVERHQAAEPPGDMAGGQEHGAMVAATGEQAATAAGGEEQPAKDAPAEHLAAEASADEAPAEVPARASAAGTEAAPPAPAQPEAPRPKSEHMDWYILKVQSNREESIREGLRRRIAIAGYEHYFGDIIIPMEKVTEVKAGKKRTYKRKLYPGYLMVQMEINEDTWFLVRETPGIGDFTGAGGHPTPMNPREVQAILAKQEEKPDQQEKVKINFRIGDRVKIKEGTFESFEGEVSSIDETNGRVTVLINIFGRSTPVDIEYWQIEAV